MAREKQNATTESGTTQAAGAGKPSASDLWQYSGVTFNEDAILDSASVFRPRYTPDGLQIAFALHPERDSGMEYSRLFNRGFRPVLSSQVTIDYDEGVAERKIVLRHYRRTADNMVMPSPEHVLMWRPVHVANEEKARHLDGITKLYRVNNAGAVVSQTTGNDELIEQSLEDLQEK